MPSGVHNNHKGGKGREPRNPDILELEMQRQSSKVEARKFREMIAKCENDTQKALAFTQAASVLGDRVDINDPNSVWGGFMAYSELCSMFGFPIDNLGAYMAMGITKEEAARWKAGMGRGERKEYRRIIEKVDGMCGTYRNTLALQGKLAPSLAIWRDKNFDNMSDEPKAPSNAPQAIEEGLSPQAIADKYKDIID